MTRDYKHPSGRIQARRADGRFRKVTAQDVGIGACPKCDGFTARPKPPEGRFIDPVDFHARVCLSCGWDSRKDGP